MHLGDLIVEGDDLYGDGVNVAARLEAEAPPGGIVISGSVHEAVAGGRLKATFGDLGRLALKNIERPVQAFDLKWDPADWRVKIPSGVTSSTTPTSGTVPLALPDKPSIAVLAFQNMSGDPEQEYFADGIAEDIITELSRFKSLFVIARNSSFTYKGRAVDVKQVGRELGVRYVLEGSVRRAGPRVRVSAQLIDAVSGEHIWSERYDPTAEDIFAVQDELTRKIVAILPGRVESAAHAHAARKTSQSLEAYELLLRAKFLHHLVTPDANREARNLFLTARSRWSRTSQRHSPGRPAPWVRPEIKNSSRAIPRDGSRSIGWCEEPSSWMTTTRNVTASCAASRLCRENTKRANTI